jgi:hypothetical protein
MEKFGSGMEKIRIKDKRPGSTILLPHIEKKGKERVPCNAVLANERGVPLKSLLMIPLVPLTKSYISEFKKTPRTN